ncbi:MAG TPA: AgmX/PglI C-terminal domain-containing protein [Kofleriaceae bacterium]|jgi:hypothetical protein|nr:AgmX/PglI C-terminal domain-containing protein [Kofleriaceae bacterium]
MKPAHRSAPEREPNAPWSLTASDGTGLELRAVDARAVVEGPLAFTELHLTFHNPEDRIREGAFSITLPVRAAVSRFAMFEDDHFREAEVVATALARRAYDDAIHENIDPAILEKGAGNQFTARVFPIPASGDKELVISYSQELAGAGYLLPLKGLPTVADVAVSLQTVDANAQHHETALHQKQWQPDHDFWVDVETPAGLASDGLVAAVFEVQPANDAAADVPTELTLLVDTSASRAPGFRHYIERTRRFVNGLAARYPGLTVDVVAFDQATKVMYSGPAAAFGDEQIEAFADRRADGASDLELAVAVAKRAARVAIITDGVVTAGLEATPLFDAWHKAMPARVDVLLAGGVRDDKIAKRLVRSGQRAGDVFDFDDELAPIEAGLGESVRVDVPVEIANATWFYPHTIPSVRAGTQVMVYARMPAAPTSLAATIGSAQMNAAIRQGTPALVERAAAGAEIAELETKLDAATTDTVKQDLKKQIETISIAARVVSSQATMLILDSDREYERYGIDRTALHDILVVGKHGLEQRQRTFIASKDRKAGRNSGQLGMGRSGFGDGGDSTGWGTIGVGRYGTIGHGSGRGSMQGRTASVPTVSIAAPMITGSLDKSLIRRYIRRNLEKVTYCYEKELLARPQLAGTLATRFTIEPDGHATGVAVSGFDDKVAACVEGVMANIAFPPTPGERVVVNYPFTFRSPNSPPEAPDEIAVAVAAPTILATSPIPTSPATPAAPPSLQVAVVAPEPPTHVATPTPAPTAAPAPVAEPEVAVAVAEPSPAPAPAPAPAAADPMPRFNPATEALRGKLAQVMRKIANRDPDVLAFARQWRDDQPTDVLAIIGLGEVAESQHDITGAARIYGSLIDLYPSRADYRRFAGERLVRLGQPALWLAVDTFRRAETDRPDQITGHRLLAYALLRNGDYAGALDAILRGVDAKVPDDRYAGATKVFHRDAGMIAAAYIAHGGDRAAITQRLAKHQIGLVTGRSLRAILYWETDANDVDLHVHDAHGGHSWYQHLPLESGGALYADITTGYGPECFEVTGAANAGPYQIGVHYYRQGPMGYGMGLVEIVRFDGKDFTFDDRPYMIMQDEAYVSLGRTP